MISSQRALHLKQAIQRFRPLEAQTGIRFYHEVGYLAVSNNTDYLAAMEARAREFFPQIEHLSTADLAGRFPYFHIDPVSPPNHPPGCNSSINLTIPEFRPC